MFTAFTKVGSVILCNIESQNRTPVSVSTCSHDIRVNMDMMGFWLQFPAVFSSLCENVTRAIARLSESHEKKHVHYSWAGILYPSHPDLQMWWMRSDTGYRSTSPGLFPTRPQADQLLSFWLFSWTNESSSSTSPHWYNPGCVKVPAPLQHKHLLRHRRLLGYPSVDANHSAA